MHPTHVPHPGPISFSGERYVRSCSYPPVALSRAYALLNLFGFRKQNWRFDIFGGVLYFGLVWSVLPVCNLDEIIMSHTWIDALWNYARVVLHTHLLILERGYVSLAVLVGIWIALMAFGEHPWPWYKRLIIGTLHTLAHSFSAVSALVLMESAIALGVQRGILGSGEYLFVTFLRNFPQAQPVLDDLDQRFYAIPSALVRAFSNAFDVPDNIACYKKLMCSAYADMSRVQVLLYYFNCGLYLWVLLTPLVSFMFGAYLYLGSSVLNAHATEAFSSLRLEGYKNFIRFHITREGKLEMYVLGIDRVPKKWTRDGRWSGHVESCMKPSWSWKSPSAIKPEQGQPDRVKLVDYMVINKNTRNKRAFINGTGIHMNNKGASTTTKKNVPSTHADSSGTAQHAPHSHPATSSSASSVPVTISPPSHSHSKHAASGMTNTTNNSHTHTHTHGGASSNANKHFRQRSRSSIQLHRPTGTSTGPGTGTRTGTAAKHRIG